MTGGERLLHVLADVEWVVGSFVCSATGELLLYSMPEEFTEEQLTRTALRLANVVRCAELCELQVDNCNFGLNRYQLIMQRRADTMLVVMVEAPVNRRALRTAMRLVLKSLPESVPSIPIALAPRGIESKGSGASAGPAPVKPAAKTE